MPLPWGLIIAWLMKDITISESQSFKSQFTLHISWTSFNLATLLRFSAVWISRVHTFRSLSDLCLFIKSISPTCIQKSTTKQDKSFLVLFCFSLFVSEWNEMASWHTHLYSGSSFSYVNVGFHLAKDTGNISAFHHFLLQFTIRLINTLNIILRLISEKNPFIF